MSRRTLVAALTVGVMAAALVAYVGTPRQLGKRIWLPPEAGSQIEQQLRRERKWQRPPVIDTHPLQGLRGSPFPPDYWAK